MGGERASGEVVDCDQTALRGIGRKYSQRDGTTERRDHYAGYEAI
jgi:hypothetical protein